MKLIILSFITLINLLSDNNLPVVKIFYEDFISLPNYYKERNFFINAEYGRANQIIIEDPALSSSIILDLDSLEKTQSLKDSVDNYYLRGVCLVSYDEQYDTIDIFTKFKAKDNEYLKYKGKTYQNEVSNEIFRKIAENLSYNIYNPYLHNKRIQDSLENEENKANFSSFHDVYDYIDSNLSEEIRKNIYLVSNGELFIKFPENKNFWNEFNKKIDTLTKLKDIINKTFYYSQVLTDYLDTLGITKDYYLEIVFTGYFNHLKNNNDYNLNGFIDSISKMIWLKDSLYAANVNKDTINGSYIPKNIDDCIDHLMKLIPDDKIKEIMEYKNENDFLGLEHMGLGMFIRNQYYLWHNSRLKVYFKTLGIEHPDVISQIILTSLYRKLYNQNIRFKELIFLFRWYQKKAEE